MAAQHVHGFGNLAGSEEVGRATAEMQLHDVAVTVEQRRHQADLAVQPGQVGFATRLVAGDDAVAATVETRTGAERHVHVDRERARNGVAIGDGSDFTQGAFAEVGRELRCGRIRGIARPRPVVATQQFRIKDKVGVVHCRRLGPPRSRRLDLHQSRLDLHPGPVVAEVVAAPSVAPPQWCMLASILLATSNSLRSSLASLFLSTMPK